MTTTTEYQTLRTIQNGNELMACLIEHFNSKYKFLRQKMGIILIRVFIIFIVFVILGYFFVPLWFFGFVFLLLAVMYMDLHYFESSGKTKNIIKLFQNGGKCIYHFNTEEKWISFDFFVPVNCLIYNSGELRDNLYEGCKNLMPWIDSLTPYLTIYPIISYESGKILETELEKILEDSLFSQADFLPQDILHKGRAISEAYVFLYVVENTLRIFIQKTAMAAYGKDYLPKLKMTRDINKSITIRKENEEKNKWLSIRGEDDLFYLDFKDLGTVITENWDLFKSCFDSQHWIKSKIDELANVRNLVAHNNSFIDDYSKDVLRLNFYQILRQIKR